MDYIRPDLPDRMLTILRAHVEALADGHVDPPAVFRAIAARVPGVRFDELYDTANFCRAHANDLTRAWRWSGTREGRRELSLKLGRGTLVERRHAKGEGGGLAFDQSAIAPARTGATPCVSGKKIGRR